jgi:hypothetical protein
MMRAMAVMERGWIGKFDEGTVGGKWHWTLTGPAPQAQDTDDGSRVFFDIDEKANPGEYLISVQRLDVNGLPLGDSQSSAPFVVEPGVKPQVDIEIAGTVTVTISAV